MYLKMTPVVVLRPFRGLHVGFTMFLSAGPLPRTRNQLVD